MQGFNAILVYDISGEHLLFCHRIKEPYKGKYNFVGGKIEEKENGFLFLNDKNVTACMR